MSGAAMERAERRASTAGSSRAYWLCQVLGWGGYCLLYYLAVLVPLHSAGLVQAAVDLAYCAAALVGTHAIRQRMRGGWNELPWPKLIPRLAASALLAAAFQTAVLLGGLALEQPRPWKTAVESLAIAGWIVVDSTALVVVWLAIYLVVQAARRRRAAELDALRSQVLAREAQLRALQQQLNPHFLFNCLNSLRGMIDEDRDRARTMVTRLAELLRAALRSDAGEPAPMEEELAAVDAYLDLEAVRLEERLRIRKEIDAEARGALFPPMLLEGLVENAVKHGIARLPAGGDLTLKIARDGERLRVCVTNSGTLAPENGTGIGLRNARERLRLLYGERARLELRAERPDLVLATVDIPFETGPARQGSAREEAGETV
jgi:hypothetical protein